MGFLISRRNLESKDWLIIECAGFVSRSESTMGSRPLYIMKRHMVMLCLYVKWLYLLRVFTVLFECAKYGWDCVGSMEISLRGRTTEPIAPPSYLPHSSIASCRFSEPFRTPLLPSPSSTIPSCGLWPLYTIIWNRLIITMEKARTCFLLI